VSSRKREGKRGGKREEIEERKRETESE